MGAPHLRHAATLLALGLTLIGCGDSSGEEDTPPAESAEAPDTVSSASWDDEGDHAPTEPRERPPATMRRFTGEVRVGGAAPRPLSAIEAEQPIEVAEGGRAVLSLRDGARVELDGPALARVLDEGAAQVLLIRGSFYAVQPPMGNTPRPPLRVVSSSSAVEIGSSGEVYGALFETGTSWLAVLAGNAVVDNGEADNRRELRTLELRGGQAVAIPNRIAEPTEGPGRLTGAREAAVVLAAAEAEREDAPDPARQLRSDIERLDQALRWLETETRRGRELTMEHRAAVRAQESEDRARLQNAIVEYSRKLYLLRRLATSRWERVRALWLRLASTGNPPTDDPIAARRDRVAGLLGF